MRRDMELIRQLLLTIELGTGDRQLQAGDIIVEGRSRNEILGHVALLEDAGLISCGESFGILSDTGPDDRFIDGLTWEGHEFLDVARSDTVWARAKSNLAKIGGPASLAIFKEALSQAADQLLKGG